MDRFQQDILGILDRIYPGRRQIGQTVHPQVEHASVIDDTLADLAGLGAVALQGFVADAAILCRLGQREAAFWDIARQRHRLSLSWLGKQHRRQIASAVRQGCRRRLLRRFSG
jgi:hypothetical protein